MKVTVSSLLLACSIVLPAAGFAQKNATLEQDLLKVSNASWVAFQHKDWATMQTLTTPDFIFAGAPGILNGEELAKADEPCKLNSYSLSDVHVRSLGQNAAMLVYTAHEDYVCGGQQLAPVVYTADIFTRKNGKWLMISHVDTDAAPSH